MFIYNIFLSGNKKSYFDTTGGYLIKLYFQYLGLIHNRTQNYVLFYYLQVLIFRDIFHLDI